MSTFKAPPLQLTRKVGTMMVCLAQVNKQPLASEVTVNISKNQNISYKYFFIEVYFTAIFIAFSFPMLSFTYIPSSIQYRGFNS
jgi:hypothetical protein